MNDPNKFQTWAINELSNLGYQDPDQLFSYIISLDDVSSVEECLTAFLDLSNSKHVDLKNHFLVKYNERKASILPSGYYRKQDFSCKPDKSTDEDFKISQIPSNSKKKLKFVSLYSEEALSKDVILLPGRHKCECQASKHKLINNCLNCGRIVCEQEGSGPCSFCQHLVTTKEEKEIINKGSKKSSALHNRLVNSKKVIDLEEEIKSLPQSLLKAVEHKNKLLDYDKTSEKRTKVYDDECDYFQSGSKWINPTQKEKLRQYEEDMKSKKYDRTNKTYTLDLLGKQVVCDTTCTDNPNDPFLQELLRETDNYRVDDIRFDGLNISKPIYMDNDLNNVIIKQNLFGGLYRLQNRELQEMKDEGMCLSMHQPWASLLVEGIKIHEGRNWYHSHRGRLWIASAAKAPTQTEISQIEQQYRVLLNDDKLKFPLNYPTSCLLGCVDVTDILPQEEYRKNFPEGESECPYVFICDNPRELKIKFPVRGQHKIYKLDQKVHSTALKSLKNV